MIVEKQLNIKDRTLLLGIPNDGAIPSAITCNGGKFSVIGTSYGSRPPYISLEIEKTDADLAGVEIYG
jgi:hypothetical protein